MAEHDRSLAKIPHSLQRFDPKARKDLVVRGLLALSDVREADFYFFKGEEHRIRGEDDIAISYYDKALRIDGEHENSLLFRGWCYTFNRQRHWDIDKAIVDFSKVIDVNPRQAMAYYARSVCYNCKGEHDKAISDCTKAIGLNPTDARFYQHRGYVYCDADQFDKAISDYNKAIVLNPMSADFYHRRGDAYHDVGKFHEAISDYTKAIEINPNRRNAYHDRARAHECKGDYGRAIFDYTKAIEIDPRHPSPYYISRGNAYDRKGDYDKAISDYTKVVEIRHFFGDYVLRGNTYRRKREYAKAISDYTKAIEINPGRGHAHLGRADAYYWMGEYDKAWEDVHKAQSLGRPVPPGFLRMLREASGRDS
jgi:tetratricopeptide (TPR) repeat protein